MAIQHTSNAQDFTLLGEKIKSYSISITKHNRSKMMHRVTSKPDGTDIISSEYRVFRFRHNLSDFRRSDITILDDWLESEEGKWITENTTHDLTVSTYAELDQMAYVVSVHAWLTPQAYTYHQLRWG